jgi:hypothetical protein
MLDNEKLKFYISVKLGFTGMLNESYEERYNKSIYSCAESFVKTIEEHFEEHPTSEVHDMGNIYFIIYTWALDMNLGKDNQLSLREKWLVYINSCIHTKNNLIHKKKKAYVSKYFDSNVFIITKNEIKDWLIPSMVPIPDIITSAITPINSSNDTSKKLSK